MELPSHPETDDAEELKAPETKNWGTVAVFVVIGLVLAVVVIVHLTGVVGGSRS